MAAADELDPITLDASVAPNVFKPHEYVQIKAEMTAGDYAAIQNVVGKVKTGQDGGEAEIALQLGDVMIATLQRMIVGWNLSRKSRQLDGSVKEVPFLYSTANVALLKNPYFNYVYNTMNKLYQDESAGAQQNFTSDATAPSVVS